MLTEEFFLCIIIVIIYGNTAKGPFTMAEKRYKEPRMGRVLIFLGTVCKMIQLVGTAVGLTVLGGTFMTLLTSCLLVGGLAVLAIERMNLTGAIALICVASTIGGILPANGYAFSFIFMAISFTAFAVMLFTMKKALRILCGILILAGTAFLALHILGVLVITAPIITLILCIVYLAMGAGLFL